MEATMLLSRTARGQEEIFNHGHTLRPRYRQILFSVGSGISFGELRSKLPNCADLEALVSELLQSGFIEPRHDATPPQQAAAGDASGNVQAVRDYVLEFMATLVGTRSPAYRQMSEVRDRAGFESALPTCRKVIAAVASPRQAAEMEAEVARRMAGAT